MNKPVLPKVAPQPTVDDFKQRINMAFDAAQKGASILGGQYGSNEAQVRAAMVGAVMDMQRAIVNTQAERGVEGGEVLKKQMDMLFSNPEVVTALVTNAVLFGIGVAPKPEPKEKKAYKHH